MSPVDIWLGVLAIVMMVWSLWYMHSHKPPDPRTFWLFVPPLTFGLGFFLFIGAVFT